MRFLAALGFLTIIPIARWRKFDLDDVGRGMGYFPLVGVVIGLMLVGLNWLFHLFLPAALVNGLIIVFLVILNGGMHLDGFVDTCDGIAGQKSLEERQKELRRRAEIGTENWLREIAGC